MYHRSETEEKRGKEKPLEHIESGRSYMKYAIIGAGGCGGSIGAFLAEAGQDVTLIARGEHLAAIREHGICVESPSRTFTVTDIKAVDEAGYAEIPDVLFVCVKGYSIPDIIPFLREHSDAETLIVPILNIYGTGAKLQQALPDATVVAPIWNKTANTLSTKAIPMSENENAAIVSANALAVSACSGACTATCSTKVPKVPVLIMTA